MATSSTTQPQLELAIRGMDCAECARHVKKALAELPGVLDAEVFLATERAILTVSSAQFDLAQARLAVANAGYLVEDESESTDLEARGISLTRQVLRLTAVIFAVVLLVVVAGEWLGLFERVTDLVPWWLGTTAVIASGFPVFRQVVRAALRKQVTSHTLMSLGVLAALVVGEWATAVIVVFFMRVGDYVETFTAEKARQAVRGLSELVPPTATVVTEGDEVELPIEAVRVGDLVVVRPGEEIPVDGVVEQGQATLNQSAITGESIPVDVAPGARVFAAAIVSLGHVQVRVTHVGRDTTFGRVIRMVEEAEANRGEVQRFADRFSGYYLPIVATIAALTFLLSGDALATAAVLVVACSCSIALATPIAMLASIGAAARSGLMLKGGKYIEALAKADVLLIDKTGTLTLGRSTLTDVVSLKGVDADELLALAASAERYSEHPLAEAVYRAAIGRNLTLKEPVDFESIPGMGVRAVVEGRRIAVGTHRFLGVGTVGEGETLAAQGKTVLYVGADRELIGLLGVSDTLREEAAEAIRRLQRLNLSRIEMLTGDNGPAAAAIAGQLGIEYRAELLPEDKIAIVKEYQAQGHAVVMIGDGVNDAPALAQADVGVAMGAAGTDIALEAAHAALMRDDWLLVVELFEIARRTMRVVKMNLGLTAVYNLVGLSLAALGFLPPVFAAAMQSIPDLGILANSSQLLRARPRPVGD